MPEEWYIIGSWMDMGKTTVGSALVRVLEEQSGATIAIKPRSNYRWHAYADDWINWDRKEDLMSCYDTIKLNSYSSLFSKDDIELAAPCQFISSSFWKSCLFVRCGSNKANNRQLFLPNENATELLEPSFGEGCYPFSAEDFEKSQKVDIEWNSSHKRTQFYIENSVSQILKINPKNIVFEGAGSILPTWRNEHFMKNIVFISNFTIYVFRDVDAVIRNSSDKLTKFEDIVSFLQSAKKTSGKLRFVAPDDRDEEAYYALKKLLEF